MSTAIPDLFDDDDDEADNVADNVLDTPDESGTATSEDVPTTAYTRREFHYATHVIPDPSLTLSIDEVRKALMPYFPDLVQATHTQRVQDGTLIVTFSKQVTRKGADTPTAPEAALVALGHAIRTLPRFRDPITSLCFPPETTLADIHARRTDIQELLDAYRTLPDTLQRMGNQCLALPPTPLTSLMPHGF